MTASQIQTRRTERIPVPNQLTSLVGRMAAEYGVDKDKFYATLSNCVFAQTVKDRSGAYQPKVPSAEEMLSLLVICDKFKLDPFLKQIYAFSNRGRIVPIVSIDGWLAIINRQPDYDGLEIEDSPNLVQISGVKVPEFCKVSIYRKSLSRPIVIAEYASEVFVAANDVWKKYPRRMLRHKAIIQAARVAFSISGIYDRDDAMSIADDDGGIIDVPSQDVRRGAPAALRSEKACRSVAFQSKAELDGALESAIKSALQRGNWSIAEQWVSASLEGTQRDYGLAYLEDRRAQLEAKPAVQASDEPPAPAEKPAAEPVKPALSADEEPPMPPEPRFEDLPY